MVLPISLQKLCLVQLPNLKGWCRKEVEDDDDHNTVDNQIFVSFPRLSAFVKINCTKLGFRMPSRVDEKPQLLPFKFQVLSQLEVFVYKLNIVKNLTCWVTENHDLTWQALKITTLRTEVSSRGASTCSELAKLGHLASLKQLKINDCPILLKRCQREVDKDWPKVDHIPELILQSTSDDSQFSKSLCT
ncbi:hypothetical protein FNV43_RR25180 [Rhamnella rubrinervis]|uniref:Uncharacterized protein n=1 Tax=Rhamnella rubrinervis TaxID=2594499 RepID=A0A8K0DZI5_9ROSA|nr:hypothetical protein FNV43_RR25180 [Rhamnella rubrinervis]